MTTQQQQQQQGNAPCFLAPPGGGGGGVVSWKRLFVFGCLFLLQQGEATIYTYNNSAVDFTFQEAFPSLPALFGQDMDEETFYRARLQYIRDNAYLCQDEQDAESRTHHSMGSFVLPSDYQAAVNNSAATRGNSSSAFVPVALLAARGFCPFYNKAVIAESFGDAVQFLIIYNNDIDGEDVLVPMYSEYGSTRLILLSVTHRTGQALKRYIAAQSPDIIAAGGPLIGFDNMPPEGILTVEDLQNYVLSALGLFFCFVSLSGCVLIWIGRRQQSRLILMGGEIPATVVAASSSRRLLTMAQIQQLVHAQRQNNDGSGGAATTTANDEAIGAASLTTVTHDDDCCAVCMEDFDQDAYQSDSNLSLPCGHLFHKDCVVPWLTERQAKCPLCKFDVAEYLRQLQAEQGVSLGPAMSAMWNPLAWLRYRSWTAVSSTGDGLVHSGSGSGGNSTDGEDEERQTVVVELAEQSATLT